MQKQTLGLTATELFACNPYRILGVAVNSTAEQISQAYKDLLSRSTGGSADGFSTPFDFDSLPPFTRDEETVRSSYVKLASNGYRCFAYSDPLFCTALNVDDVALNINDFSCYDCFLRCYMWLVINDRNFEEHALWIPLAKYIDKMIASGEDEWPKYFDNRFPENIEGGMKDALANFYATFREIILLPIKELVRGSMKCTKAADILAMAGVSIDEPVPKYDIPQANKDTPEGRKLKIAVKEGEEYFDISEGRNINFESRDTEKAQVEHNVFTQAATKISAQSLVLDDEEYEEPVLTAPKPPQGSAFEKPQEPQEENTMTNTAAEKSQVFAQTPVSAPEPEPSSAPVQNSQNTASSGIDFGDVVIPRRNRKIIAHSEEESADNNVSSGFSSLNDTNSLTGVKQESGKHASFKFDDSIKEQAQEAILNEDSKSKQPYKRVDRGMDLINSYDQALKDDVIEDDESEKAYADILVEMLRSNRTGAMMKSVDANRSYQNGGKGNSMVAAAPQNGLEMDAINMKHYDKHRLNSSAVIINDEEDIHKVREQKYRDININDMINPNMGKGTKVGGGSGDIDPIEAYKIEQKKQKHANASMWKFILIAAVVLVVLCIMLFSGIF